MAGELGRSALIEPEFDRPGEDVAESAVLRKVARRLVPFLFLLYVANILDRSNVSFARFKMLPALGLDESVYGLASGFCFYLGYLLFEVPSNLILHRVGARRWISRIMVTWGIVSASTMFVRDARSFYLVRILLGIAEAGFFPGIVLYLSYWFPARERARVVACFMAASPISGAFGGPLSGYLLDYSNGAGGLAGWQWLFVVEAIPSVILGIVTWFYLTDRPSAARWLSPAERGWLAGRMAGEERSREARHGLNRLRALANPRIGLLILLYFTIAMGSNGFGFYGPAILKQQFATSEAHTIGYLWVIPNLSSAIGMILIGRHSDRTGERRWHLATCAALAAVGWLLSATARSPWLALLSLTMAQVGMMSMIGPFWSLATSFLSGAGAAGGIALINMLSNTGGALSPLLVGWLQTRTGSFAAGQYVLALALIAGAFVAVCIRHDPSADRMDEAGETQPSGGLSRPGPGSYEPAR
jgi:MFS transporter, ACS family, tartrate transporter